MSNQEPMGNCPKCGSPIYKGKYGAFCSARCGMSIGKAMGATLTDEEIKSLLAGEKIFLQGLRNKAGKVYNAYLTPCGIEEYTYIGKDEEKRRGYQYKFKMEFGKRETKLTDN